MSKKRKKVRQLNEKKLDRLSISPRLQLGMAILLFALCAVLVHERDMTGVEIAIISFLYNLPDGFTVFFTVITQLGNIYVLISLALLLLIKRYYHIVVRLLFTGSLAYLLTGVMKDLIGRGRPDEFVADIVFRDLYVRGSGFPSGHVALATALILTISLYLPPKYKWIAPVGIVLVGLSRMHLGVHGPMDVIGGFAIGWAAVALFKFVHIRLSKSPS